MISNRDSEPNLLLGLEPGIMNVNCNNTLFIIMIKIVEKFKVFLTPYNGKRASPIRNERKKTTK